MKLTGLHILLTYECNFECDHCFVWGSPWQSGTLSLEDIHNVLHLALDVGTIDWIYFEGGEPFLYYPILLKSVKLAHHLGFKVGLVSNSYWGTTVGDAIEWLLPFSGIVSDLSISSDLYHFSEETSRKTENAMAAARELDIPLGVISVAQPTQPDSIQVVGQLPLDTSGVMYRGRAAAKLASQAAHHPWSEFTECPYENLRDPGRIHLDPLGELHICQGISIGNLFKTHLKEIISSYDPDTHPITAPLLKGGPAELVRRYKLSPQDGYADACHLCYTTRLALRDQFPESLTPDQVYGVGVG
jgi:MoaA/NifB/PqqE/SkfB family radical SAM enzyme